MNERERRFNAAEYQRKQLERQSGLLKELNAGAVKDRDIWNLEMMITNIQPHSLAWRSGYIKSLRRAIHALEKENRERSNAQ